MHGSDKSGMQKRLNQLWWWLLLPKEPCVR